MSFDIQLSKENFKFSGSHFTILSPTKSERFHGHNYYVRVKLQFSQVDDKLGFAFDFNNVKPVIKDICKELDEYTLIPEKSPFLEIKKGKNIEIKFSDKFYSFPADEVRLLPIANITTEELARYVHSQIKAKIKVKVDKILVNIQETQGQSASFSE